MPILSSISNTNKIFWVSKCSSEDININSVLTVDPGEEAIFVNNGNIVQVFENGRYELKTENYPFLSFFRNLLSSGISTYHCKIYFVSTTQTAEILWGTSMPMRDPVQNIYTKIFLRGSYRVKIEDSSKFLVKLLGMGINFLVTDDFKNYFNNQFLQHIINITASTIESSGKEILKLCTELIDLSSNIQIALEPIIADYGLTMTNFSISAMELAEDDPNRQILEQAYAKKREKDILASDYQTIKETDANINMSKNEGMGGPIGFGAAMAFCSTVNNKAQESSKTEANQNQDTLLSKLESLKKMLDQGLITQDDYNNAKADILQKMIKL